MNTAAHLTINDLSQKAIRFVSMSSVEDLANLLGVSKTQIHFFANNPSYTSYWIKKKKDGNRLVEDPCSTLKGMQRTLNTYLQSAYHFLRTEAAYGFVRTFQNEKKPRNIISNARQHLQKPWMLNLDFKDFFHHIHAPKIMELFQKSPFKFETPLAQTLTQLVSYQGRLPMGAPTSPVLSNFATIGLDHELLALSAEQHQVYTRFADDLTFSSNEAINAAHFMAIETVCRSHHFEINPAKTTLYEPHQPKIVTGLLVTDRVDVPDVYYGQLLGEIEKYEHCREVQKRCGVTDGKDLLKYEQELRGAIQFVEKVVGKKHAKALALQQSLAQAKRPVEEFMSVSWLDFNY